MDLELNTFIDKGGNVLRRLKSGDIAQITKPVCVRRHNGKLESFNGRLVKVVRVGLKNSQCDIGLDRLVYIPNTHLRCVA